MNDCEKGAFRDKLYKGENAGRQYFFFLFLKNLHHLKQIFYQHQFSPFPTMFSNKNPTFGEHLICQLRMFIHILQYVFTYSSM